MFYTDYKYTIIIEGELTVQHCCNACLKKLYVHFKIGFKNCYCFNNIAILGINKTATDWTSGHNGKCMENKGFFSVEIKY